MLVYLIITVAMGVSVTSARFGRYNCQNFRCPSGDCVSTWRGPRCREISSGQGRCNIPAETGLCKAYIPSWYYDSKTGTCKTFIYGGCGGNDNRFSSQGACTQACSKKGRCNLPAETGLCKAYIPSWYYDSKTGTCKTFIYGGCGGNDNRFSSQAACTKACSKKGRCNLPAETGLCKAYIPSWYYDSKTGTCKTFIYGGCGGNDNRFSSKRSCERACSRKD